MSLLVVVCCTPVFVQTTVVPTAIVTLAGSKAKSTIRTATLPGAAGVAGVVAARAAAVGAGALRVGDGMGIVVAVAGLVAVAWGVGVPCGTARGGAGGVVPVVAVAGVVACAGMVLAAVAVAGVDATVAPPQAARSVAATVAPMVLPASAMKPRRARIGPLALAPRCSCSSMCRTSAFARTVFSRSSDARNGAGWSADHPAPFLASLDRENTVRAKAEVRHMDEHEHRGASASGPILARRGFIALAGRTIGATVAATLLAACGGATVASTPATATAASTIPAQATTPATATTGTTPPAPPLAVPQGTPTPQATATSPATATTMPMPSPTRSAPAPTAAARAATTPATPAAPGSVAVRIVDFAFDPASVTIAVGTTVVWTNTGVQHTTTSSDNVWGSEVLERGDSFRYPFTRPGTYPYICGLHPDMHATIIVR